MTRRLRRFWPASGPPPRSRAVTFKLPSIGTVEDAARAAAAILKAAAEGEMTPEEASTLVAVAERYGKLLEASNLEKRILALEQAAGHEKPEGLDAGDH